MEAFDTSEDSPNVVNLRDSRKYQKDFVVRNDIILLRDNFAALGTMIFPMGLWCNKIIVLLIKLKLLL